MGVFLAIRSRVHISDDVLLTTQEAPVFRQALEGRADLGYSRLALPVHGTAVLVGSAEVGTVATLDSVEAFDVTPQVLWVHARITIAWLVTGSTGVFAFVVIVVTTEHRERRQQREYGCHGQKNCSRTHVRFSLVLVGCVTPHQMNL